MTDRKKKSGGQRTAPERWERFSEAMKANGWKRVPVVVPEDRADDIREIARKMREEKPA